MNKKTKLYIDTSVWNFALEAERRDYFLTNSFFNYCAKSKDLSVYISDLVATEIDRASSEKREKLLNLIDKFKPELFYSSNEAFELANIYVDEGLIPQKARDDAVHIAIASVNRCDFIVSWNFKHIVRAKTIKGVHLINLRESYGLIEITSPREFLEV